MSTKAIAKPETAKLTPLQVKQNELRQRLDTRQQQLLELLPTGIDKAAYWRKILFAIFSNPAIAMCEPMSIIEAVNEAVQLGLDPTGILGEGYLVPIKGKCDFWPGFQGFLSLARRSGEIKSIEVRAVFDGDVFECEYGSESRLVHKPDLDGENIDDPSKLTHTYMVAKLASGGVQFEVMSRKAIDRIRAMSPMGNSGPWRDHFVEMAKKTVVRRAFKSLPRSAGITRLLELEARNEAGATIPMHAMDFETLRGVVPPPQESGAAKLKAAAEAATASVEPPPSDPPPREPGSDDDVAAEQAAAYKLSHPEG